MTSKRPKRKAAKNADYTDKQAAFFKSFFKSKEAKTGGDDGSAKKKT